jgi:hypothetical protein
MPGDGRPISVRHRASVLAGESGYVVRYDPRPVIVPAVTLSVLAVVTVILTGDLSGSWLGSTSAAFLFFRRTWLVTRRKVAFEVGPSGVYLGATLGKPRQRPEFIPWEKISALEVSWDEEDNTYVLVRGLAQRTDSESTGRWGPRIAYRKVDGWHLDRHGMEDAVRRCGARARSSELPVADENGLSPEA